MIRKQLDITNNRIWKDKHIKPESKLIYSYIYSKGCNRFITDLNVGELQQIVRISNVGLKNNLSILQKYNYLNFIEYDKGMYEINIK